MSREYTDALRYWKKRLGLSDWRIGLRFVPATQKNENAAEVWIDYSDRTAEIHILSPEVRRHLGLDSLDPEKEIVHELLHICLYLFDPGSENEAIALLFEQTINTIADALIAARHDMPPED